MMRGFRLTLAQGYQELTKIVYVPLKIQFLSFELEEIWHISDHCQDNETTIHLLVAEEYHKIDAKYSLDRHHTSQQ
jgi:hypothetical protein